MPQTLHLNLESGFLFDAIRSWAEVIARPHAEKVGLLRQPAVRARMAEAAARRAGASGTTLERLRSNGSSRPNSLTSRDIRLPAPPDRRGVEPFDLFFDVAVADDLRTLFVVPAQGDDPTSWKRRLALLEDPRTIIGGSDAGAHLDMSDTFAFFTDFVGPSVRERQLLPLESAVRMITNDPARSFGLRNRGRVESGYAADVVVFDEHEVGGLPVETRADLPGGGTRLSARPQASSTSSSMAW